MLERFQMAKQGTTAQREVQAGLVTFMAMAYIVVVNPSLLSQTGMDYGAVFVCLLYTSDAADD